MNTTAGICSTRARYFASMFNKGASGLSCASAASARSRVAPEVNDCCCKKTLASSCRAFSASDKFPRSLSAAGDVGSPRESFPCVRYSSAMFRLLRYPNIANEYRFRFSLRALPCPVNSHLRAATPGRFLIKRCLREAPQGVNRAPIGHHRSGRKQRTGRLVHKRHELVRKSRHGAADANPADVGTTANSAHPAALSDVALHHRSPASEFYDARGRAVFFGELRLLVISAAIASFVHRRAE